jgi:hypothetical protein
MASEREHFATGVNLEIWIFLSHRNWGIWQGQIADVSSAVRLHSLRTSVNKWSCYLETIKIRTTATNGFLIHRLLKLPCNNLLMCTHLVVSSTPYVLFQFGVQHRGPVSADFAFSITSSSGISFSHTRFRMRFGITFAYLGIRFIFRPCGHQYIYKGVANFLRV